MRIAITLVTVLLGLVAAASAAPPATPAVRDLQFNGRQATGEDLDILARLEAAWGVTIPAGRYWYDGTSGAAGQWGGPVRGVLPPGLPLGGGIAPANASGGGDGTLTGVFINGRELHPLDVAGLTTMLGQRPWPGRWWVDGAGNFGPEGGVVLGNLVALANQRARASGSYYRSDPASGSSVFVGSGCTAVSGRTSPSDSDSSYSYYVGC